MYRFFKRSMKGSGLFACRRRRMRHENMTKSAWKKQFIKLLLIWFVLFTALAFFTSPFHPKGIAHDGIFYYITLRSVYLDGDIDFANEAKRFPWVKLSFGKLLKNGLTANPFPIGSAILWSPFYVGADLYCSISGKFNRNGYSPPYVKAVMLGSVFWVSIGLLLCAVAIRRLFGDGVNSWITVALMLLASPLAFYIAMQPDYSHANSFFAVSLLLYLSVRALRQEGKISYRYAFFTGVSVGVVFLVRWQDVLMGAIPVVIFLLKDHPLTSPKDLLKRFPLLAAMGLGALLTAVPQMIYWKIMYGSFITVPMGGSFLSFKHIAFPEFFLSTWNGVFLWHPLLLLALVGLVVMAFWWNLEKGAEVEVPGKRNGFCVSRWFIWTVIVVVGLEFLLCMMVEDWWSGGSFGQRRLVAILPLMLLGFHYIMVWAAGHKDKKKKIPIFGLSCLLVFLVFLNLLTMARYHQRKLPYNPPDPNWYASKKQYSHYDYFRRFRDIFTGRKP